jgi:hypothetical protein
MRPEKCSLEMYLDFMMATQKQYSCLEFEKVTPLEEMAHDAVNRWLNHSELNPTDLWDFVSPHLDPNLGYLILDDTLIDKPYAKKIELIKWQWSGKHHSVKQGIGVVNMVWAGLGGETLPVDFRIYQKDNDERTKNDHFRSMLETAKGRGFKPTYVLMDSWYSSKDNLKMVEELGWYFMTDLKANRNVSIKKGEWIRVSEIEIAEKQVMKVWIKHFGPVMFCKRVLKNGDVRYLITNNLEIDNWDDFISHSQRRWQIENMHRGLKQVCGIEKCYMRRARAQINHIFCSFLTFIRMELIRIAQGITWYQQKWEIPRSSVRLFMKNSFA